MPGEQVGIVQCAREAGGEAREQRAGIDGCNIGTVQYADADDDGRGHRHLHRCSGSSRRRPPARWTAPLEAERCIVAMGAISDYDRSGGFGVAFAGGGEPIDIPTITVSPAEGLADGDVVHVEGDGFEPNAPVMLSVCSIDPAGCWSTGEPIEPRQRGRARRSSSADEYGGGYAFTGLLADADGRVSADVPVWRFLPGPTPASYVDCAVSACRLRVTAEVGYSPAPADPRLRPRRRGAAAARRRGRPRPRTSQPGDEIVVRGAGLPAGRVLLRGALRRTGRRPDQRRVVLR